MSEQLTKLQPDRDLQCYFERPSAIAALSSARSDGFVLSGGWRQQFDWAVVEWNRDNVFEHLTLRNLPDGDLSGLTLTYDETRTNCIGLDSDLYPTVDWPYLRIWANPGSGEQLYMVPLKDHASAVEGSYTAASIEFELQGTPAAGDYIGLSWLDERHTYQLYGSDSLTSAVQAVVDSVNAFSPILAAERNGAKIKLLYVGADKSVVGTIGANGNRLGVYGYCQSSALSWDQTYGVCAGGTSPSKWRITLNFGALTDRNGQSVPTQAVRKMRWTYSAELQQGAFARTDFVVRVSNWSVSGTGRVYHVAGPGSQRWEDTHVAMSYSGEWQKGRGNFSAGTIHYTTANGASVQCRCEVARAGDLYLGSRYAPGGATVRVSIDGQVVKTVSLAIPGEDSLCRIRLASVTAGNHTVLMETTSPAGAAFYLDFLELAVPATTLPEAERKSTITLATDWDTDHSIALPAERTSWLIRKLGFYGRANHYVGALWFYELLSQGNVYASSRITLGGTNEPNKITTLRIGRVGEPASSDAVLDHLHHVGDSTATVAAAFYLRLNNGFTGVRATVSGNVLTIWSRALGAAGNQLRISVSTNSSTFTASASGSTLTGGIDGEWQTDLTAVPRLNRAARDWSQALYSDLSAASISVTAAFSTELQHGPTDTASGIAQRYPSGAPVLLNTPALQTNFSPASLSYWREVYAEMAELMVAGNQTAYLQFGEVQWWYFPYDHSGMPFYDGYTTSTFQSRFGRPLPVITSNTTDPQPYLQECEFLAGLIGEFTSAIRTYVRTRVASCRFEVLYPTDVNDSALNTLINYPHQDWTPANLDCLKTENFTYTGSRNLRATHASVGYGATLGFPRGKRSHLVGLSDFDVPWLREVQQSEDAGLESTVLFALDQFCLIGYATAPMSLRRRSTWSR